MLHAGQIAEDFQVELAGDAGAVVRRADRIPEARAGSLAWMKSPARYERSLLDSLRDVVIVVPAAKSPEEEHILAELAKRNTLLLPAVGVNPRLVFAKMLARYFSNLEVQIAPGIHPSASIHPSAKLGDNVTVSEFCFIGADVEIGDGTILHPGAIVHSGSVIGRNCIINSHAVIGNRGFGFVRDESGALVHFPHIGRAVIEDDVEIQANTVVDRPPMGETRIGRGTKVDNLCHIGHGAMIGPHCVIAACTEVGAQVVIEEGAWIGPNSCSIENITFGKNSYIGIGSTVTRSVPPGAVFAGSPAEPIENLKNARKAIKKLVDETRSS